VLDLQRPAVEKQRVPGLAPDRRGLVHDAAGHAGVVVFRALGQRRPLVDGQVEAAEVDQRGEHRRLQRGRRGEAGAEWHVGGDGHAGAGHVVAGLAQHPHDARDVGCPARYVLGEVEGDPLVGLRRPHRPLRTVHPGGGDDGALGQCEGEHEAVVVVGVLADQVDPPGRGPHPVGLGAVDLAELLHETCSR
jgi:hypothetical protein